MITILLVFLFVFLLLTYLYLRRNKILFWLWSHSPKLLVASSIFNKLYQGAQTYSVSHQERKRLNLKEPEYIYGEVIFSSFITFLRMVKPRENDIFYDFGSGAGKAVMITALVYENLAAVIGLELLPALHQLSLKTLAQLRQQYPRKAHNTQFIAADFLTYDFSNATIIFINAAAFMPGFWQTVIKKLEQVKSGCRIIVTSKYLPAEHYDLLNTGTYLMGWGDAGVNIYLKK